MDSDYSDISSPIRGAKKVEDKTKQKDSQNKEQPKDAKLAAYDYWQKRLAGDNKEEEDDDEDLSDDDILEDSDENSQMDDLQLSASANN